MSSGYYRDVPKKYDGDKRRPNKRKKKKFNLRGLITIVCIVAIIAILITAAVKMFGGKTATTAQQTPQKKERVYNIPPASEENDLVKIATEAKGTEGKKICYLTFDDGPTKEVTPKVLDVLKKYNVKATFFCMGKMLDANSDIAMREFNEGHLIANHSYNHDYNALYATSESFMSEIKQAENKIRELTGEEPFKLMRFPGGSYNAGDHAAEKQVYKKVLKENGYYYADWNCLNGDAEVALRSTDELINKVKATATQKNIVVLMHDAAAKKTTPDALGTIIEYLKGQGYEFRRLDEIDYYDNGTSSKSDTNSMVL